MNYLPHTAAERRAMLDALGIADVDLLFADIPTEHRAAGLDLPAGIGQLALERELAGLASANRPVSDLACFLGAGAYHHYRPPVVDSLVGRGEFFTAYTPYQPEISQGTLTAIFEFQSLIAALTGMDIANASLYDGASALAEATLMATRVRRQPKIVLAASLHPAYAAVTRTYTQGLELPMATVGSDPHGLVDLDAAAQALADGAACITVGYPNFYGVVEDIQGVAELAHAAGALLIVVANPIALGLLEAPGRLGADIVVGDGQPLGIPLQFGGPYLGLLATRKDHMRQMPGRVVGETVDGKGRRGYVMTLRAREQDIRREKSKSNICTNQALAGLTATIYLAAMGESGLREVARQCYHKAHYAYSQLVRLDGVATVFDGPFFHEFALRLPRPVAELNAALLGVDILGPYDLGAVWPELADTGLFCVTEMNTRAEIDRLVHAVEGWL